MGLTKNVDFPTAKLLKEKEFDEQCIECYTDKGKLYDNNTERILFSNSQLLTTYYSAPTIAEVVMWLYEKHGIWVEVNFLPNVNKFGYITKPLNFKKPKEFSSVKEYFKAASKFRSIDKYNSPTEAYQEAIKYTLNNLIK